MSLVPFLVRVGTASSARASSFSHRPSSHPVAGTTLLRFRPTTSIQMKATPPSPLLLSFLFILTLFFTSFLLSSSKSLYNVPPSFFHPPRSPPLPPIPIPISVLPSPSSSAEPLDPDEKFLGFLPHSGFHNQRMELQNALMLGKLLNRTVLIPPIWIGWPTPTQFYYDLVRLFSSF